MMLPFSSGAFRTCFIRHHASKCTKMQQLTLVHSRSHVTKPSNTDVIDLDDLEEFEIDETFDATQQSPTKKDAHSDSELRKVNNHDHAKKSQRKSFFDVENRPVLTTSETRHEVKICIYLLGEIYALNRVDIATLLSNKRSARATPLYLDKMFDNDPDKLKHIVELVGHAQDESEGYYGLQNLARKFGRIEEETRKAIRAREWSDRSLEAKHLEYSCKTSLKREYMAPDLSTFALARHGRTSRIMAQRLLRAAYEEFETISATAVGNVFNYHRERSLEILREHPMRETVAAFCRFVAKYMMGVSNAAFHALSSQFTHALINKGIYRNSCTNDPMIGLHRMIEIMDPIVESVERLVKTPTIPWIDTSLENFLHMKRHILDRVSKEVEAPAFVHTLAAQFHRWENLLKCDVQIFRGLDSVIFDIIAMGATLQRVLRSWSTEHVSSNEIRKSLKPFATLLNNALKMYAPGKREEITKALNSYCGVMGSVGTLSPDIFVEIELKMDAYGMDLGSVDQGRVRLIYHQFTEICCQTPGMFSLVRLLTRVSANMIYHLRFKAIMPYLNRKQKIKVSLGKAIPFDIIEELEKSCKIQPPAPQTIVFLTTVFMYLLTTNSAASTEGKTKRDAPLNRLVTSSGSEEFALLILTCQKPSTDLKIHHPVQFEHKSWMDADERGIYHMLPSQALMGAMSRQFWRTKPPVLEAADCISRVAWRFNRFILHVEEMIILEGYGFHKLTPSFYSILHMKMADGKIPSPSIEEKELKKLLVHKKTNKVYKEQAKLDKTFERGLFSNRRLIVYALRMARSIINKSQFFIPHKLDFRGRLYSLPGHVNPGGSDPHRALLDFADPKPLGKHGFHWLKIHLANVMGCSKLSFDERIQYIDDHMDDIVQSAESPLGGDRWWQQGSEPIQALRACKEVYDAMASSQGVENFESRLPIQIDGTCNGLQHYSAIARDEVGGLQVNLVPTSRPQDVYAGVLRAMMVLVQDDARNDHLIAQRCIGTGKDLDRNHVTRKTIKQAVMTQVYGVTNFGMRAMILKELEVQNHAHQLWSKSMITDMACYLCDKLMLALGITFRKAGNCRKWLNETVETIWRCQPDASKQCFQWITPLGLIVRQPYTKGMMTNVFTPVGTLRIECSQVNHASINQLSAFAPNLIHSLDACHLSMTALEMDRVGLKFAAVHDSFWTHACDLPVLSRILRQEFANLYKNFDPLWELKEQLEEQFYMDLIRHGVKLKDPPQRGSLNLDEIMKSKYFFA